LWLLSLLLIIFSAIETSLRYANNATITIEKNINSINKDTIFVSLKSKDDIGYRRGNQKVVIDNEEEKLFNSNISVTIKPTNSDKAKIVIYKKAYGISVKRAKDNAEEIEYSYTFKDGELKLNSYFLTEVGNKLKSNKVKIVLYLPKNKIIVLDETLRNFIRYSGFEDDVAFDLNENHIFKMTEKGLKCLDCKQETLKNKTENKQLVTKKSETKKIVITNDTTKPVDSITTDDVQKKKHVKIDKNGVKVD
jgi:hypothetical protein